ncbi:DNA polymerase IV [Bacterioplanes sanyensis]|uniref:DNA polymerase IV n=1 Tax=Bacterioplanes sanyensis TaxID=1249553 RepID=UPI0016770AEB|nr:DNA polymerase IV [Bacterioplanes sanyensis]GGY38359.1 DNA polymerase IV [Bacterioplanes sanyensis]
MRKIIHVDCDCFFAAVEMRDNPALAQVPMAIGGRERRGVISTCNYPAREFGVRSAMPVAQALKLCPHLVLMPGRMSVYKQVSAQVMAILRAPAEQFEQVSIDEAFLQVDERHSATQLAQQLRDQIWQQVGITVSAGISVNKFLAKVASDWNKPNGQYLVGPNDVAAFVAPLPVRRIPGVGPALEQKLQQHGIHTCADAQAWSLTELVRRFGRSGATLFERCRGLDERPLRSERVRKTISVEKTFLNDLTGLEACLEVLPDLLQRWQQRLMHAQVDARSLAPFVKVKFADFHQTTLADHQQDASADGFAVLLARALKRDQQPVRLLGIGGRMAAGDERQLTLFEVP